MTFPENCAVYQIMWKNMVEPFRPQLTDNTEQQRLDLHTG